MYYFSLTNNKGCTYKQLKSSVRDEGNALGQHFVNSSKDCEKICDDTITCQSVTYAKNSKTCYLKDRQIAGNEPQTGWDHSYTVYKICGECP